MNTKVKNKKQKTDKKRISNFKKFLAVYAGLLVVVSVIVLVLLHGLLVDYEASEPNNTMNEIIEEFSAENVGELIRNQEVQVSPFESEDMVVSYFEKLIGDSEVSYKRTNGEFTPAKPVYTVYAGEEKIAKVKLAEDGENGHGFTMWKLGEIDFENVEKQVDSLKVTIPAKATLFVNGIEVTDEYKLGEDTVVELTKNLSDYGKIAYTKTYEIKDLMAKPSVVAKLGDAELIMTESQEGDMIAAYPTDEALLAEQTPYVTEIFEHYGKYIINRGNLTKLLSYTVGNAYTYLSDIPAVWAYLWGMEYTYEFQNESVSNLVKFSDECYSVDVYFDLYVDYGSGNTTYNVSMTYIFIKQDGVWYLADFIQH